MESEGYIRLDRNLLSSSLWSDGPLTACEAWIWLLLHAAYKTGGRYTRGELTVTRRQLEQEFGWGSHRVVRFLTDLEADGRIEYVRSADPHKPSTVRIVNWGVYQGDTDKIAMSDTDNDTDNDTDKIDVHDTDNDTDKKRRKHKENKHFSVVCDTDNDTDKIVCTDTDNDTDNDTDRSTDSDTTKEINNKKNITIISDDRVFDQSADADGVGEGGRKRPGSITQTIQAEFETVWADYPRKEGKANALRAFSKARKEGIPLADIHKGVKAYARKVAGTEKKYIKQGSTFFNGRCWQDEELEAYYDDAVQPSTEAKFTRHPIQVPSDITAAVQASIQRRLQREAKYGTR